MPTTSARLLTLLSLLQTRRDWPGAQLAQRLDISQRTVRRDIDRLRELGYPIHATKGPDGGYRLHPGTQLPPLLFDDDQAIALTIALQHATTTGADIAEAATRALNTIRHVLPTRLRHRIDTLHTTTITPPDPPADPTVLMTLNATIHATQVLRFDYGGHRRAEPHHLLTWHGRWYLLAWDLDRDDWRTFRADRITPHTPTGPRFTPRDIPGTDVATLVASRFRGADSTGDWPCRGEVILDLPAAEVAPYVRDGLVEALGTDRCTLTLGSWSWTGLAAGIGRFDADIEVIGPPELGEACARLSRRYANATRTLT